jgi:hypothetical protein
MRDGEKVAPREIRPKRGTGFALEIRSISQSLRLSLGTLAGFLDVDFLHDRKRVAGTALSPRSYITIWKRLLLPERAAAIMMVGATEDANADFFPKP